MKQTLLRILAIALLSGPAWSRAEPVQTDHVEAELVAEATSVQPGQPFWVGLRLKMDDHWHVYWRNPGDAGLPTTLDWDLPEGFEAGAIQWPHPERILVSGLANYGFEDEMVLPVRITPPAGLEAGSEVSLQARADWLVCKEACIPGGADLSLTLPVSNDEPAADTRWSPAFAAARKAQPQTPQAWTFSATKEAEAFVITATPPADATSPESVYFFPYEEGTIDYSADQPWTALDDSYTLSVPRAEVPVEDDPKTLSGVLMSPTGWDGEQNNPVALEASFSFEDKAPPPTAATDREAPSMSIPKALLYGVLGGLLLNLMPCVFPVISLKIMGFVQAAQGDRRKAVEHAMVFTAGIVLSFWVLALVIVFIKMGGEEVGWAFQFQEPGFVIFMALLFTLIALNMFGLFEIGTGLAGVGGKLSDKSGWAGSFFSGVLATLVATPCTGPFMAPVLGWALSQPAWAIFMVLTALGLGMAVPYVLLSTSPKLMEKVPKPGPWMESFKQALGFVLIAFALAMVWVLGKQTELQAVIMLLGGMYLAGIGAWILGRWGALHRSTRSKIIGRILATAVILGGVLLALSYRPPVGADELDDAFIADLKTSGATPSYHAFSPEAAERLIEEGVPVMWQPWSPERLDRLRSDGKPVFIDFTAAWCMICQANKAAMHADSVEQAFAQAGVTSLEADWTKRDAVIQKELERYGRSGVPLYLLYPAGDGDPAILPQNLTTGILMQALEDAGLK